MGSGYPRLGAVGVVVVGVFNGKGEVVTPGAMTLPPINGRGCPGTAFPVVSRDRSGPAFAAGRFRCINWLMLLMELVGGSARPRSWSVAGATNGGVKDSEPRAGSDG